MTLTVPETSGPDLNGLIGDALDVLLTKEAAQKANTALQAAKRWRLGRYDLNDTHPKLPPDHPARPDLPELLPPKEMPRRRLGSKAGQLALIHAIAHIELNAIDLAWDMIARFARQAVGPLKLGNRFLDDWVKVGEEEAKHFLLLNQRLEELGSFYGAAPAHAGLWDAALATKDDLLARLTIVPMVLEARGLDVNPGMANRLRSAGDTTTADILDLIYTDEIGHVKIGSFWFHRICQSKGLDPKKAFACNLTRYFKGQLKPPFNTVARELAGVPRSYYEQEAQKHLKPGI